MQILISPRTIYLLKHKNTIYFVQQFVLREWTSGMTKYLYQSHLKLTTRDKKFSCPFIPEVIKY